MLLLGASGHQILVFLYEFYVEHGFIGAIKISLE